MAALFQTVFLIFLFCRLGKPLDIVETAYVNSQNVEELAHYLHEDTNIQDTVIVFPAGISHEKLMEVPIGYVGPEDTIVMTIDLKNDDFNEEEVERDLLIGITDGPNTNFFMIPGINSYEYLPPCFLFDGSDDDELVHEGTKVPPKFRLTFQPAQKYGACETLQEEGYINTGYFTSGLDLSFPLYLRLSRHVAEEKYRFFNFMVEVIRLDYDNIE